MDHNKAFIKKLGQLAHQWGGELVELSRDDFDTRFGGKDSYQTPRGLSMAPFSSNDLGTCFSKKQVIFAFPAEWHEVVHEMGHIFACKKAPGTSKEWTFFGWEYALAIYLGGEKAGLEWIEANDHYGLGRSVGRKYDSWDFGGCSTQQRQEILEERVAWAKKNGLVAKDGTPLAIR